MAVLDVFASPFVGDVGDDTDIHVVANAIITSPVRCKNLIVDPGVLLQVSTSSVSAEVWASGDIRIQGTIKPLFPTIIAPGVTPAINWDGAASGTNGSAVAGGAAGTGTAGVPTLHDLLYNGNYNGTVTDYRWTHLMRLWGNPGAGGNGWNADTGAADVLGGLPGGNLLMVARGIILIDDSTGGVVDCSGANGASGNPLTPTAQGGGGAGAGGAAILVSFEAIFAAAGALIDCSGGNGGKSFVGAGGRRAGGGAAAPGGIIAMIAPEITVGLASYSIAPGIAGGQALGGGASSAGGGGSGGSMAAGAAGGAPGFPGGNAGGGSTILHDEWSVWQPV